MTTAEDLDREWDARGQMGAPHTGVRVHPTSPDLHVLESAPQVHPDEMGALTPRYYDVAAMLDGTLPETPVPDICRRTDGVGLFYLGQFNVVFGDPESGKTLLTDHTTAEVLSEGGRVLRLDLDHNGPESTVSRLLAFGAPKDALRDPGRFLYVEPDDRLHLAAIAEHMGTWLPTLVVLDSIGELLPMFGSKSNDADEFTRCHSSIIKPLVKTGAAVIGIDHLSKGADSRAFGPTGTAAKRRATGGTSIRVKVDVPFTPGKGGSAYLSVHKDRHGGLRQSCPVGDREPMAGKFLLDPDGHGLSGTIRAPMTGERDPGEQAPVEDVAALDQLDPPPKSARDAKARMNWRDDRSRVAFKAWQSQRTNKGDPT